MSAVVALAIKDLRMLVRLRSALFFTFAWPVGVAILFGLVFAGQTQGTVRALRVAIVDEDDTEASRSFISTLQSSGDFIVEPASRADAEAMVRRGQRSAFIVITPGFGERSGRPFYGPPREIEIGIDPARQAEASMIEGLLTKHAAAEWQALLADRDGSRHMVDEALKELARSGNQSATAPIARFLTELDQFLGAPPPPAPGGGQPGAWQPLAVQKRAVALERRGPSNGFEVTFPQGVLWGIIGCVMSFAIGLVSERVRGTYVRLQMAPLTRGQILAGKALGCFAAITLVETILFVLGVGLFGVRPSSYALLVAACLSASMGFVSFMMMVAGLSRTEQAAAGAGWAILMPMTLFGGGMMPQFVMPPWMQAVGHASPVKWAILGIEGAVWRDFTAAEMMLPCTILLLFGLVCFAIGLRGLRSP
jgi:ABC-2 type transport system permease protein